MIQALTAIGGIVGMMLLWAGVQSLWKRTFADYVTGEDAMAGRTKCAGCGCKTACVNKKSNVTPTKEGSSSLTSKISPLLASGSK